jgi:hypothetical protein
MSALPPEADIGGVFRHVCLGPDPEVSALIAALFTKPWLRAGLALLSYASASQDWPEDSRRDAHLQPGTPG